MYSHGESVLRFCARGDGRNSSEFMMLNMSAVGFQSAKRTCLFLIKQRLSTVNMTYMLRFYGSCFFCLVSITVWSALHPDLAVHISYMWLLASELILLEGKLQEKLTQGRFIFEQVSIHTCRPSVFIFTQLEKCFSSTFHSVCLWELKERASVSHNPPPAWCSCRGPMFKLCVKH